MADEWPRIRSRRARRVSPWMEIIEREVEFAPDASPETYHAVGQADYIGIIARTPAGLIPIVRQYRPAIESFTWELPAGLVDPGEDPADGCMRELMEETGLPAISIHWLGSTSPCTGRLGNRIHSFFVETSEQVDGFVEERGRTVRLVTAAELAGLIGAGEFVSQLHLGTLLLAEQRSFLELPRYLR